MFQEIFVYLVVHANAKYRIVLCFNHIFKSFDITILT